MTSLIATEIASQAYSLADAGRLGRRFNRLLAAGCSAALTLAWVFAAVLGGL